MKFKSTSYALLGASLLALAACGDDNVSDSRTQYPATPSTTSTSTSTTSSPSATTSDTDAPFAAMETLPPECDTESSTYDTDTSRMTAAERQTLADKCEAAQRRSPTQSPDSRSPDSMPPR